MMAVTLLYYGQQIYVRSGYNVGSDRGPSIGRNTRPGETKKSLERIGGYLEEVDRRVVPLIRSSWVWGL